MPEWTLTFGMRAIVTMTFLGEWDVRQLLAQVKLFMFSATSPTRRDGDQLIRKNFPPPVSPSIWDGVGSLLVVGLYVYKYPNVG
jgi:hypothetical protein